MNIHPKLEEDSLLITDLELSQVRLIKDADNPWLILIPKRENKVDWDDLEIEDQILLTKEISYTSKVLKQHFDADKINIASLGNMVPQLHIHVIVRYKSDRAWPNAIWGTNPKNNFSNDIYESIKKLFVE